MKKFLILIFTILIGLGLINKLYNNNPMYEDGALEEYITYLENNLPSYVPKLLENPFNEGVFEYDWAWNNGDRPYQELKEYMELTTGIEIQGKIKDLNDDLSEEIYEFYNVQHTYKVFNPVIKKMHAGKTMYILKTEWENPELEECTVFIGGPGQDSLIDLIRQVVRYVLAFTIMPIYIVHSIAVILWGLVSL